MSIRAKVGSRTTNELTPMREERDGLLVGGVALSLLWCGRGVGMASVNIVNDYCGR